MPDVIDDPLLEQDQEEGAAVDRSEGRPEVVEAYIGPAAAPNMDSWGKASVEFNSLEPDPVGLWVPIGPAPQRIRAGSSAVATQGPGPVAGEVTGIAIDPTGAADQTIYVATNNGGVWKSTDGGTTFVPKTDGMMSLSMGAVALDPGNPQIVYAGSGNLFDGGHQFQRNAGLYKSVDGGETWTIADGGFFATVLSQTAVIQILCPAPDQVLVATIKGLYYSVDGGLNFGKNAPKYDDGDPIQAGFITSLIADFASPATTFYAAVQTQGIFTVTIAAAGAISVSATNLFATSSVTQFSDIALAMGPDSSLYASVQFNKPKTAPAPGFDPTYVGLFRKRTGQNNWTKIAAAKARADQDGAGQTNYDLVLGADPQVQNGTYVVYLGFQELWRSTDGTNFASPAASSSKIHYDQHALVFSPQAHWASGGARTTVYAGNDGGLARSIDGGINWTNLNATLATSLFYGIDIGRGSAANNAFTYGGMQDTGTAGHRTADPALEWNCAINGDGGRVAVDPTNPQIVYGFDNQFFIKTTNGGNSWQEADGGAIGIGLPQIKNARLRIAIDPTGNNPAARIVYVSVNRTLYRSTNAGVRFTRLAPNTWPADITCIAVAPQNPTNIWIGLFDGTVHFSSDSGQHWDTGGFTNNPIASAATGIVIIFPCADIAVDPANVAQVAVVFFGQNGVPGSNPTNHCYLTTNTGGAWQDISGSVRADVKGNLPDLPLRSVAWDSSVSPSRLIVAADGGVMASDDLGANWRRYGVGLPVTPAMDLAIDNTTGLLRVATYGRSAWEFTKPTTPALFVDANLAFDPAEVGQKRTLTVRLFNAGDQNVVVSAINHSGSNDFTLDSPPTLPLTVLKHTRERFTVRFSPSSAAILTAKFDIVSNDPNSPATILASGVGVAAGQVGPRLAVIANLNFGEADTGDTKTLPLSIQNTGAQDLIVSRFERRDGSSDFNVGTGPATPFPIAPGDKKDYTIEFKPASNGPLTATFEVTTNASISKAVIEATGTGTSSSSTVWIIVGIAIGAVVAGVIIYEVAK